MNYSNDPSRHLYDEMAKAIEKARAKREEAGIINTYLCGPTGANRQIYHYYKEYKSFVRPEDQAEYADMMKSLFSLNYDILYNLQTYLSYPTTVADSVVKGMILDNIASATRLYEDILIFENTHNYS